MHFRKLPQEVISYKYLKKTDNERFMNSLQLLIVKITTMLKIRRYLTTMHQEKMFIHGNNKLFMNKVLSKAIMHRTRLKKFFF